MGMIGDWTACMRKGACIVRGQFNLSTRKANSKVGSLATTMYARNAIQEGITDENGRTRNGNESAQSAAFHENDAGHGGGNRRGKLLGRNFATPVGAVAAADRQGRATATLGSGR